jgi:hypothetical protein
MKNTTKLVRVITLLSTAGILVKVENDHGLLFIANKTWKGPGDMMMMMKIWKG